MKFLFFAVQVGKIHSEECQPYRNMLFKTKIFNFKGDKFFSNENRVNFLSFKLIFFLFFRERKLNLSLYNTVEVSIFTT
jgi:hypothetical protein